jgi:hypothetical protein
VGSQLHSCFLRRGEDFSLPRKLPHLSDDETVAMKGHAALWAFGGVAPGGPGSRLWLVEDHGVEAVADEEA